MKNRRNNQKNQGVSSWGFNTVDQNGIAPYSRVQSANDAFTICWNLRLDNSGREAKWGRVYKCYKGFPPTDYSQVASNQMQGLSNVPFRQMTYIIDNQKSSYVDMVMERNTAATIITKLGNPSQKNEWSDLIGLAFEKMLRRWNSYNYNIELDVEEMSLYGKGFEIAEDKDGWPTKSFHNSSVLIPDRTYADLTNLGELCLKRSYTALEFWLKITGGEEDPDKAQEHAKSLGWNFWACVDALRLYTTNYRNTYTNTEWLRDVASGNLNLSRLYTLRIEVYELYIMEYDGSISKMLLLQNYGGIVVGYRENAKIDVTEEEYIDQTGFLYHKRNWVEKDDGGWDNIIAPITDSTGSGIWHEIQGLGEKIFIQCRAYDIHMNRFMDAVDWNTRLMFKGGTAESTKKLKQMQWQPFCILPQDVEPQQVSVKIPFNEVLSGIQFYQNDLYRGIGAYSIGKQNSQGVQRTRGEAELDAAESAKLQGTQIRRFNDNQTRWLRMLYKRMCNTKHGGNGYDIKQYFVDFLKENEVPDEAWQLENIESIESNMLSGSGSPSYKLMAAKETVSLTGIQPANDGQANAIEDAIASLNGRQNVKRYIYKDNMRLANERAVISMENIGMTDPKGNPANFQVYPDQNHIDHFEGHAQDAQTSMQEAQTVLQSIGMNANVPTQNANPEQVPDEIIDLIKDIYACLIRFKGPHLIAHFQYIAKDQSKKDKIKQYSAFLQSLQRATDELGSQIAQIEQSKQKASQQGNQQTGINPVDAQKIQAIQAKEALRIDSLQKRENIRLAALANKVQLDNSSAVQKTGTDIATKRAQAMSDIQIQRAKAMHEIGMEHAKNTQDLSNDMERHTMGMAKDYASHLQDMQQNEAENQQNQQQLGEPQNEE